jgi:hypothetical protein
MNARIFIATALFGLHAACAHAQEPVHTYQPANFPADQARVVRLIDFPRTDQDVLVRVYCEGYLSKYGNLERSSICLSGDPAAEPYALAVGVRISRARLEPARVDGRRVPIWFQYTVQFEKRGDVETIKLFPHHFLGVEDSGEGYTGPQRYRDSKHAFCQSYEDFWFIMNIPAEGGAPTDVVLENPTGDTLCADKMQTLVEDTDYIPAFRDGIAVAAPYRERWWRTPIGVGGP